jgi:hypothetical protein
MTERAPDRIWSGIQISKVVAGTLAAVSAAVIGSYLGVAGTLAGAAIASIVGSVGTEIYQRSLDRGAKKIQTLAPTFVKAPAAIGTPEVAAATDEDSPSHTVPEELKEETPAASTGVPKREIRWSRVGLAAVALFLLAMVPLTVVEMASGRTLANIVGSSAATGTTLGTAVTGNERRAPETVPSEAPSEDETTAPATDDEPSDPAATPTTTDPAIEPRTEPTTAPTTGAPTTEAPQPTGPADPPQDGQQQNRQEPGPGTE